MKRLILLLFLILVFPSSSLPIPYPGVDSDEYEDLSDKITRTRESDVESSRTDNPTRKASEDKRPWVGDSLIQAEDTIWPNFSSWNGPPTYPNPDGSRSVFPWDWLGHSWQGCTVSCDSTGWETSDLMGTNDCEAGKEIKCAIWPIITQTIVENVTVDGPVWWELKSPSKAGDGIGVIVLKIYPNATPGTKISIIATTVSLSLPGGSKDTASSERNPTPSGVRLIENNSNFDVFRANLNRASDADARTKVLKVLSKCDKTLRADCEDECVCVGADPTIEISDADDWIARETSFTAWVDSGGLACPPYEWSITGTGFSITSGTTTNNDLETITIGADGTACGSATITVTDDCGLSNTYIVRCTTGIWGNEDTQCNLGPNAGTPYYSNPTGQYRYQANDYNKTEYCGPPDPTCPVDHQVYCFSYYDAQFALFDGILNRYCGECWQAGCNHVYGSNPSSCFGGIMSFRRWEWICE